MNSKLWRSALGKPAISFSERTINVEPSGCWYSMRMAYDPDPTGTIFHLPVPATTRFTPNGRCGGGNNSVSSSAKICSSFIVVIGGSLRHNNSVGNNADHNERDMKCHHHHHHHSANAGQTLTQLYKRTAIVSCCTARLVRVRPITP